MTITQAQQAAIDAARAAEWKQYDPVELLRTGS